MAGRGEQSTRESGQSSTESEEDELDSMELSFLVFFCCGYNKLLEHARLEGMINAQSSVKYQTYLTSRRALKPSNFGFEIADLLLFAC